MNRNFATVSSTGGLNVSPWQLVDPYRNPFQLSLAVYSSGGSYWLETTLEDPTGTVGRPSSAATFTSSAVSSASLSSAATTGVYPSSLIGGWGGVNSSAVSNNNMSYCFGAGTANVIGGITQPIAAWRLVSNSTTAGGTITAVGLQSGPR